MSNRFGRISLTVLITFILATLSATVVLASTSSGPTSNGGITPYIVDNPGPGGNVTCEQLGYEFTSARVNYDEDTDLFDTTFPAGVSVTVTDDKYVGWTSTFPIGAVIVKGSNAANIYEYIPAGLGDSGLASPTNASETPANLSNLTFCWDSTPEPETGSITIQKISETPGYDETVYFDGDLPDVNGGDTGDFGVNGNGGIYTFENLTPGTYNVSELVPDGWDLASVICNDDNSTGNPDQNLASIDLQPGETVTCTFTNTKEQPQTGSITIIKDTAPDDPQDFSFNAYYYQPQFGLLETFNLDDDGDNSNDLSNTKIFEVAPGKYGASEAGIPGWLVGIQCVSTNPSRIFPGLSHDPNNNGTGIAFDLEAGEEITCTFTNTKEQPQTGKIIVKKETDPDGDPQVFDFTASYDNDGFSLSDGQMNDSGPLTPGPYSVSETVPDGWALQSAVCDDDDSTNPASLTLDPGETITCTFTNIKEQSTITIVKNVVSGDTSTVFNFLQHETTTNVPLMHGQSSDPIVMTPGVFNVIETVPQGWDLPTLDDITCVDQNGNSAILGTITNQTTRTVNAFGSIAAGQQVICTFNNTQEPPTTITIVKNVVSGDTSTVFNFLQHETTTNVSLTHGQSSDPIAMTPGVFNVIETVPQGWDLPALDDITCVDQNGNSAILGTITNQTLRTVNAFGSIAAGQQVICTFNNTQEPPTTITIVKNVISGDTSTVFNFLQHETTTNVSLMHGQSSDPIAMTPGVFNVIETVPQGWQLPTLADITCVDQNGNSAILGTITNQTLRTVNAFGSIAAGQQVTCTFNNTQQTGSITIIKDATPADGTNFEFSEVNGRIDPFLLDDAVPNDGDAYSNSQTFSDLAAGSYSVIEQLPAGWDLTGITCDDNDSTGDLNENAANINLQAGEHVTCTFTNISQPRDLIVTKTADPYFKRIYKWAINKNVDKTLVTQIGGSAQFNYTVNVWQTGFLDSHWRLTGKITVTNPNPNLTISGVNVTDTVSNGGICSVTGGNGITVPAGGSVTLDYTCKYFFKPKSSSGINTATATWNKNTYLTPNGSASGSADFNFNTPTAYFNKTVTVKDTFNGSTTTLGTVTATDVAPYTSQTFSYTKSIVVSSFGCKSYTNTAKIVETSQQASKTVKVCSSIICPPKKSGHNFWGKFNK